MMNASWTRGVGVICFLTIAISLLVSSCDVLSFGGNCVLTIKNSTSSEITISKVSTGPSIATPKSIRANSSFVVEEKGNIYIDFEVNYLGVIYVGNSGESSTDYSKYTLVFSEEGGALECSILHSSDGKQTVGLTKE